MILSTYKNISINLSIIYRVVRTLLSGQVGNLDILRSSIKISSLEPSMARDKLNLK